MAAPNRATQERTKATVRALHIGELESAGAARAAALQAADAYLDRVAQLLPNALHAGLSLSEIARVSGISRPTLYELRARYGQSARDLELAVLQAIALRGPISIRDLGKDLRRPSKDVAPIVKSFVAAEFVADEVDEDRREVFYWLLDTGRDALEAWYEDENERTT